MKKVFLFISICLVSLTLITSCAPSKYVHNDPVFSYEYPSGYKADKVQGKNEVARFSNPDNAYKLPTYVASVAEKPKGAKLEDLPDAVIKSMQKDYPQASRFKILESERVKLSDGSEAMTMKLKWKFSAAAYLQTASVMALKGDKMITISGTTVFGYTPLEEMMKHCLTLSLLP
ncbi:MAG: hypothetical protein MUP22_02800 [Desulfobacterales bacterium]|nr:hypothetical protein [Desulfobacterales bacterium]